MLGGAWQRRIGTKQCNIFRKGFMEDAVRTCQGSKLFQVGVLVHIRQCVLRLERRQLCQASHGPDVLLGDCKASLGTEIKRPQLCEMAQGLCQVQPQQLGVAAPPPSNLELLRCSKGSKAAHLSMTVRKHKFPGLTEGLSHRIGGCEIIVSRMASKSLKDKA